jgi:hypothetical protein
MSRIDLRLTDEEFWELTPRLFRGLYDRFQHLKEQEDFRAGTIAAAIGNAQGGKKNGGVFTPSDYFTFTPSKKPPPTPKVIASGWDTWARLANKAERLKGPK